MAKTPLRFPSPESDLTVPSLASFAEDWLMNGQFRQLSPQTLDARRFLLGKLVWFLNEQGFASCGTREIRAFFAYINTAHQAAAGRWSNSQLRKPVRPRTLQTYFVILKTFFAFLLQEGSITVSPMETLKPPIARQDQIVPFTDEQVETLLAAARRSKNRRRDEALVYFLLDTGCRASEVCSLRLSQVDLQSRRCNVTGKGNKSRSIYFGKKTMKALWAYLKDEPREGDEPLFVAARGQSAGEPLTRSGLLQLIERLGKAASIDAVRCSPGSPSKTPSGTSGAGITTQTAG